MDIQIASEIVWMVALAVYAFSVVLLTKRFYDYFVNKKHMNKSVAVYYNRKFIHIFAGGFVVLAVPFVFYSPIFPLLAGVLLTIIMIVFHKSSHILYWFQTDDNVSDVSFCLMWGVAIFVLWYVFQGPYGDNARWLAVIPAAFIAFGDGVTGLVRNFGFKQRSKHPIGNIYMACVCIPIGYYFGSLSNIPNMALWGIVAAIVATFFERYELGPIDDNVLITVSSTIILFIGAMLGSA
jgi:hypothetical protein